MHEDLEFTSEVGKNNSHEVIVYALSTCGFCKRALNFLRKNSIEFRYIYVDKLERDVKEKIKNDLKAKYETRVGFPFMILDGKAIVGFIEDRWKDAFGM